MLDEEMSPQEAGHVLGNAIISEGKLVECKLLVDWLKVALDREGLSQLSRLVRVSLTTPLSNRMLMEY